VYAVGDVIGAPALAATAMEQGRRAVCHALGLESGDFSGLIPIGIYTIPEISSVGMDEATARATIEGVRVGRSRFDEVARGQISRIHAGMLKMVADTDGNLLGVQIAGDGAAELIHLGQMVLRQGGNVSEFVESVFNFPTLAEAYRVAALDLINQRASASRDQRLAG
jgi:NAD(P) transhydrogenase